MHNLKKLPPTICGQRPIVDSKTGSFTLPRVNREVRANVDTEYLRYQHGDRWYIPGTVGLPISNLEPVFRGSPCYIIGKGPSLDGLSKDDFREHPSAPVIAINESILKVETLGLSNYICFLQQDITLGKLDVKIATPIISYTASQNYDLATTYVYRPEEYGGTCITLSVLMAIDIAHKLHATELIFLCFDSMLSGELTYATCVGKDARTGGALTRFLGHKNKILMKMEDLDLPYSIRANQDILTITLPDDLADQAFG